LTSNQGNGVKVTKVTPSIAKTEATPGTFTNKVTLRLYVNDSLVSEKNYDGAATVSFGTFNATVNSSKDAIIRIEADFGENVDTDDDFKISQ
jgi:hypothetical protein